MYICIINTCRLNNISIKVTSTKSLMLTDMKLSRDFLRTFLFCPPGCQRHEESDEPADADCRQEPVDIHGLRNHGDEFGHVE